MPEDEPNKPNTEANASQESVTTAAASVDARGLRCPEPLMLARNRMRQLSSGEILHVQATDPTTDDDLRKFCHFMGHQMVQQETHVEQDPPLFEYWLQKA